MRRSAIGAALLALAVPAAAQAQNFEFIVQAGATLGKYSGDQITSGTRAGFQGGGKVRVGGPFYLDGGVLWGVNGGKLDDGSTADDVMVTNLRFPVTFGVRVIRARVLDVRFFLGGVLDAVSSVKDNDFGIEKDDVRSSIFNGRVGAGIDVLILAVDVAYEFGAGDVFEESAGLGSVKRHGWVGEVGLRFAF